jgi:hypothetical protein
MTSPLIVMPLAIAAAYSSSPGGSFVTYIPFYPTCNTKPTLMMNSDAPIRIFRGAADCARKGMEWMREKDRAVGEMPRF